MGGILRCIRNEYNLDQLENEINKSDNLSGFDEIMQIIKQNNNAYIDTDDKISSENSHYAKNFLEKLDTKRSGTFCINAKYKL